ncbi:hypothetical protein OIU74_026575 [Salix koriyanagi]|uniref:Uncharacterized protein n=2 Tax=Salix TaxID=40685 RepID=A0A9Q0VYK5_9ROSI|nr:hypothetical protein OIU74_026575 [Salix koriyanagi]
MVVHVPLLLVAQGETRLLMFFSYESLVSSYLISHFQTNPGYAYRALCINKRKSLRYLHK